MSINEIFPNPTVKQVIFQIRYPNLFYMENKIGDLQLKIMNEFPQSKLIIRRDILVTDIGSEEKFKEIQNDLESNIGKKIWQFKSEKNFMLNILSDSLDITSEYHKTYNLDGGDKFRDAIEYVINSFFEIVSIPVLNRIGLRYIDECPLPNKDNKTYKEYYNTCFPIDRFNINEADEMNFKVITQKGEYNLRYLELLRKFDNKYKVILDFDAFALKIVSKNCLKVTDKLHNIIIEEFEKTIKEPIYKYMRQK